MTAMKKRFYAILLPILTVALLFCACAVADGDDANYTWDLTDGVLTIERIAERQNDLSVSDTPPWDRSAVKALRITGNNGGFGTIGGFSGYPNLKTVEILSGGCSAIGMDTFNDCSSLESVTLPASCTVIEATAFQKCTGLKSVQIPDTCKTIGICAFQKCTGLESVKIPASCETIGDYAFDSCTSLKSVQIPDKCKTIGICAFNGCTGLKSVKISDACQTVGPYAFQSCTGLTSAEIPSGAGYGSFVFNDTRSLTTITVRYDPNKQPGQIDNFAFPVVNVDFIIEPASGLPTMAAAWPEVSDQMTGHYHVSVKENEYMTFTCEPADFDISVKDYTDSNVVVLTITANSGDPDYEAVCVTYDLGYGEKTAPFCEGKCSVTVDKLPAVDPIIISARVQKTLAAVKEEAIGKLTELSGKNPSEAVRLLLKQYTEAILGADSTADIDTILKKADEDIRTQLKKEQGTVGSVRLNKSKATLYQRKDTKNRDTLQLKETVTMSGEGTRPAVVWKSSKPTVAKVDKNGLVTALKKGTATITATCGDKTATCKITIKKNDRKVTKITAKPKKLTLKKGKKATVALTFYPKGVYNNKVKWTTSDKKIATVSKYGVITAKKKGKCTITATSTDKNKKKVTIKVTVR